MLDVLGIGVPSLSGLGIAAEWLAEGPGTRHNRRSRGDAWLGCKA